MFQFDQIDKMSQQPNLQSFESREQSEYSRQPKKLATYVSQFSDDFVKEQFFRSPSTKKHKTYTGIDSVKKTYELNKYRLDNMDDKKMFLALSLCQKFIEGYEEREQINEIQEKKLHQQRKIMFQLNSSHDFKTIEPISANKRNQEKTYNFIVKLKDNIKYFFRQNFISEIKKKRNTLQQITDEREDNLEIIQETEKENKFRQPTQKDIVESPEFIASDFSTKVNASSLSSTFPQVDMIAVSVFPTQFTQTFNTQSSQTQNTASKFHAVKLNHSRSRLRVHPAKNKYESRKKEEIRLFLQLNEKTEHLENFRSDEGKFFKLNQNLKITVKSISFCRVVLLSKKEAIQQQLSRLGDDSYFKTVNEKILLIESSRQQKGKSDKGTKKQLTDCKEKQLPFLNQQSSTYLESCLVYKQKALRIKNYFEETTRYFSEIEFFLLQFLKGDKGYKNYMKENSLKSRISQMQKITQQEKFYREFVDKCFHISEISRIYFNALNQFAHQNINLKELKLLNKHQLEKINKVLIELRYVIIYLQKECQNTNENSFFNKTQSMNFLHKMNQTVPYTPFESQEPSSRSNANQNPKTLLLLKPSVTSSQEHFKESQNTLQLPKSSTHYQISRKPSQIISVAKLNPVPVPQKREFATQKIKRDSKHNQPKISSNSVKSEQIDMNQIWKTFYDKKFSSNAMRLRLY